jgi:hypothetical protein
LRQICNCRCTVDFGNREFGLHELNDVCCFFASSTAPTAMTDAPLLGKATLPRLVDQVKRFHYRLGILQWTRTFAEAPSEDEPSTSTGPSPLCR